MGGKCRLYSRHYKQQFHSIIKEETLKAPKCCKLDKSIIQTLDHLLMQKSIILTNQVRAIRQIRYHTYNKKRERYHKLAVGIEKDREEKTDAKTGQNGCSNEAEEVVLQEDKEGLWLHREVVPAPAVAGVAVAGGYGFPFPPSLFSLLLSYQPFPLPKLLKLVKKSKLVPYNTPSYF